MTRETLEKAIQFGLRKGAGKDAAGQSAVIADAIEWAIEMDADAPAQANPEKIVDWPIQVPIPTILPPSPASVTEAPSAQRTISTPAEVRHIEQAEPSKPITLEQLIQVLNTDTPQVISAAFPGKQPYLLERNVISDPLAKSARLIYKHPPAPDGMEASVVFLAENGAPDLQWGMQAVHSVAMKVYAPKTQSAPVAVHEYEGPVIENARVDVAGSFNIPGMDEVSTRSFNESVPFRK